MDDIDEADFGGRGDEPMPYPPIGSDEWYARQRKASEDLNLAWAECFKSFVQIHTGVAKIFREFP